MKMMNLPEEQMSSWKLRQPASRLKHRIFNQEATLPSLTWFWGALAPAAVCILLTLGNAGFSNYGGPKGVMALASSNQSEIAYATGGGQVAQNHWASVTFDWTNRSVFNFSNGFTPTTNYSN